MLINSNLARYCCILYICLIRVDLSCGVTIRQRFKMEQLRNVAIRITIPDEPVLSLNPKTSHINRAGHEVYLTFRAMLGVFNITETFVSQVESGVPDEYGNYSGLIGIVQRNEADTILFMVRPDALLSEPVRIGFVYGPDEMILLSSSQPARIKELDLSQLFSTFDLLAYCYMAFCTYFVVVVSTVIRKIPSVSRFFKWKAMLNDVYAYCWSILQLIVDQENYSAPGSADRFLWLSYCIASFVLIFGFLTNLMSTDLVAFIKPPDLHSLDDLFTPNFEPMNPIILTNLPSYSLIKHAKPTTSLGLLYHRLIRDRQNSIMNVNLEDPNGLLVQIHSKFERIQKGQLCLATTNYLVTILRLGICAYRPEYNGDLYYSNTFAQGLMTAYYSKALPTQITNHVDYKGRTFHEMAVLGKVAIRGLQLSMAEKLHEQLNWKYLKCFHSLADKEDRSEKANRIGLALYATRNIFLYGFYAICLASLVLFVEYAVHRRRPFKKIKKKSKTKPKKPITRILLNLYSTHKSGCTSSQYKYDSNSSLSPDDRVFIKRLVVVGGTTQ